MHQKNKNPKYIIAKKVEMLFDCFLDVQILNVIGQVDGIIFFVMKTFVKKLLKVKNLNKINKNIIKK